MGFPMTLAMIRWNSRKSCRNELEISPLMTRAQFLLRSWSFLRSSGVMSRATFAAISGSSMRRTSTRFWSESLLKWKKPIILSLAFSRAISVTYDPPATPCRTSSKPSPSRERSASRKVPRLTWSSSRSSFSLGSLSPGFSRPLKIATRIWSTICSHTLLFVFTNILSSSASTVLASSTSHRL